MTTITIHDALLPPVSLETEHLEQTVGDLQQQTCFTG